MYSIGLKIAINSRSFVIGVSELNSFPSLSSHLSNLYPGTSGSSNSILLSYGTTFSKVSPFTLYVTTNLSLKDIILVNVIEVFANALDIVGNNAAPTITKKLNTFSLLTPCFLGISFVSSSTFFFLIATINKTIAVAKITTYKIILSPVLGLTLTTVSSSATWYTSAFVSSPPVIGNTGAGIFSSSAFIGISISFSFPSSSSISKVKVTDKFCSLLEISLFSTAYFSVSSKANSSCAFTFFPA